MKKFLAVVAVVAAALFTSAGLASAADNANGVPLYANNAWCNGAQVKTQPVVGKVNFHQDPTASGDPTVLVNYELKSAKPDTTYTVELWSGFCSFDKVLGTATTNSEGVANLTASATVKATDTSFFVFAFGGGTDNESALAAP